MPMFFPSGAKFLGKTTPLASSNTTTPTIVFGPGYEWLFVYHYIAGYTSGGGIARIQLGTASTVDTGANYGSITARFIAGGATVGTTTSTASTNGFAVANVATTFGRRGQHMIWNPTTDPKFIDSRTATYTAQNPTTAASAHGSLDVVCGNWWNNAEAQCVAMDGGGSVSLLTGSYISVYGVPR